MFSGQFIAKKSNKIFSRWLGKTWNGNKKIIRTKFYHFFYWIRNADRMLSWKSHVDLVRSNLKKQIYKEFPCQSTANDSWLDFGASMKANSIKLIWAWWASNQWTRSIFLCQIENIIGVIVFIVKLIEFVLFVLAIQQQLVWNLIFVY